MALFPAAMSITSIHSDSSLKKLIDSVPDSDEKLDWPDKAVGTFRNIEEKRRFASIFRWFNAKEGFGCEIAKRIAIEEFWVRQKEGDVVEGEAVYVTTVEEGVLFFFPLTRRTSHDFVTWWIDMVNSPFKILHGGCATFLIDM